MLLLAIWAKVQAWLSKPQGMGRGNSPHPSGLHRFLSMVSGRQGGMNWALYLSSNSTFQVFYNFQILPEARKTKTTLPLLLISPASFHPGYPSSPCKVPRLCPVCGPRWSALSLLGHTHGSHCPCPRAGQRVWPGESPSLGESCGGRGNEHAPQLGRGLACQSPVTGWEVVECGSCSDSC